MDISPVFGLSIFPAVQVKPSPIWLWGFCFCQMVTQPAPSMCLASQEFSLIDSPQVKVLPCQVSQHLSTENEGSFICI
jgi:hypothetical protein